MSPAPAPAPAGFWHRYAAWSLDWLLLGALLAPLLLPLARRARAQALALQRLLDDWVYARMPDIGGSLPSPWTLAHELLQDPVLAAATRDGLAHLGMALATAAAIAFGASAVYFVLAEAGPWQGTPGKRLLRLRVRTPGDRRVGAARAFARHLGGALGWAMLNLGHALAALRADKRALHDLLAGTQVLADAPMPRWAKAWLWLQGLLVAGVLLGLLAWLGWVLLQLSRL